MGLVHVNKSKLEELLSMDLESLQVKRAIIGHDKAHAEMATSLKNLALV